MIKYGVAVLLCSSLFMGALAQDNKAYSGPQAVVYIGEDWCSGGYCSGGTAGAFEASLNQALIGSGYVRAIRKREGANLIMRAGITGYNNGGGVCLPIVGCLNAKTVNGTLELSDAQSGSVIWRDTCQGTSAGYSSWWYWTGSISLNSDEDKAAADCAAKLVQKLTASAALKPYLTVVAGSAASPAPAAQSAAPQNTAPAAPASPTPAAAVNPAQLLEGALKSLAFAEVNAQFTSDVYNPVKLKELNAAANAQTQSAVAKLKFGVTPGEQAGIYQLLNLTYTLPDGQEKFVQLAMTSDPSLNTRGGQKLVYLSAFHPLRAGNSALDGLSKNVEQLLSDLHSALGLPKP